MLTQDIRRQFLDYFRKQGHEVVPSAPVLPHEDPTLLFINAGMNQFKDVFLGEAVREYTRAATSQKCIRAGGKHNDLDNVGHTSRHLTFFEMLGNFSFGDYFKEEAIRFSWEVSTEVFGLDPEKIWPTVFREDDEAFEMWKAYVPEERIKRFDEADNFWAMGDTGPCGPCSELLYDRGPAYGSASNPHEDNGERYLEYWNLVFMQYNKDESGVMHPLPKPCVDTGAGLERLVALKMGVDSLYETDLFASLIQRVEEVSGVAYRTDNAEKAPAFRVIADHLRCLSFAIADGVQPSNVDRGYVLRKILRRAVRYGRILGMKEPFLAEVFPRLLDLMGEDYPELKSAANRISEILTQEEEGFLRTLKRGGNLLNQVIKEAHGHENKISGEDAFKLKDTYGLPLEEILLFARDAKLDVDEKRYLELEEEARERSRQAHKTTHQIAEENLFADFVERHRATEFSGYDATELAGAEILGIVKDGEFVDAVQQGDEAMIILDKTPFYAEMGGQIGDTGELHNGSNVFRVTDCQAPYKGVVTHIGFVQQGELKVETQVDTEIDSQRRQRIANNHTATHLLHWALQEILGDHVRQAGSVVTADRLRFDFSHHKALTQDEIRRIEDLINQKIRTNQAVKAYELPYEEVQQDASIKQFFGEKYGKWVRVVDVDFCKELCGGTHTSAIGNIGYFRIAKEGSIAAGVRRIEAVTGMDAEAFARETEDTIAQLAVQLKTQPQKLQERMERLLEENKALQKEAKQAAQHARAGLLKELLSKKTMAGSIALVAAQVSLSPKDLRPFAEELLGELGSGVVVLGAAADGKGQLLARVSDDLIQQGVKAVDLVNEIAPLADGRGGGKADAAQAGVKAPEKIETALHYAVKVLGTKTVAGAPQQESLMDELIEMLEGLMDMGISPPSEVVEQFLSVAATFDQTEPKVQKVKKLLGLTDEQMQQ